MIKYLKHKRHHKNLSAAKAPAMNSLNDDMIKSELIKHCTLPDLINLKTLNKKFSSAINDDMLHQLILETITNKLKEIFGVYWDPFSQKLEESGALISGSFFINCILGVPKLESIDLYMVEESPIRSWLNSKFIHEHAEPCGFFDGGGCIDDKYDRYKFISHEEDVPDDECGFRLFGDTTEKETRQVPDKSKPIINIITVSKPIEYLEEYILNSFEFDLCRNVYGIKHSVPYIKSKGLSALNSYHPSMEAIFNDYSEQEVHYYFFNIKAIDLPADMPDYFHDHFGKFLPNVHAFKLVKSNIAHQSSIPRILNKVGFVHINDLFLIHDGDFQSFTKQCKQPCLIDLYQQHQQHLHAQPHSFESEFISENNIVHLCLILES